MTAEDGFNRWGTRSEFALEVRLLSDPDRESVAPRDAVGSWGEWRLWVAGENLSRIELTTPDGVVSVDAVRWYLAPLFRWLVLNWNPLLHEARWPAGLRFGEGRPRWARAAYLSMVESSADDLDRFLPWQGWASRHSLRAAAEGSITPDVFFQRVGDNIEISWGDRVQPGAESARLLYEDGVSHVQVDQVGAALQGAIDWFVAQETLHRFNWMGELMRRWTWTKRKETHKQQLSWYLDSQPQPGPLEKTLRAAAYKKRVRIPFDHNHLWQSQLAPQVAMFGSLSPKITTQSATKLLTLYFGARDGGDSENLAKLVEHAPAWLPSSPWDQGYALARHVLDAADPAPQLVHTDVHALVQGLGIAVEPEPLGEDGPRGVALAGRELKPTIVVNVDHLNNRNERGQRFTIAHEFCHILYDREHAATLAHSSTPWAPPAIEQRANAFAAMLLMPPNRLVIDENAKPSELESILGELARSLRVSKTALVRHAANLGVVDPAQAQHVLSAE